MRRAGVLGLAEIACPKQMRPVKEPLPAVMPKQKVSVTRWERETEPCFGSGDLSWGGGRLRDETVIAVGCESVQLSVATPDLGKRSGPGRGRQGHTPNLRGEKRVGQETVRHYLARPDGARL